MPLMSRRKAIACVTLGAAGGALTQFTAHAAEPSVTLTSLKALPPHWLDPVIGDGTNPEEIAARFAKNKDFIALIAQAIKDVKDHPPQPGLVGPTYPQRVRLKLLALLSTGAPPDPVPPGTSRQLK